MLKRKIEEQKVQFKQVKPSSGTLFVIQNKLNAKAANLLTKLVCKFERKNTCGRLCLLIKGAAGSGKTYVVKNTMKQLGIRMIEINSGHKRDVKSIKALLNEAIKNLTVEKNELSATVVFVDDIDIALEADFGFEKALKWLISESKCPVIMTCQIIPASLKFKDIEIVELEKSINYLEILYNYREKHKLNISNIEILYLFRYYKGNLNFLFTALRILKKTGRKDIFPVKSRIISSTTIEIEKVSDALIWMWDDISSICIYPLVYINSLATWLEILELIDLTNDPYQFLPKLLAFFNRHHNGIFMQVPLEKKQINFRKLAIMGDPSDYISFMPFIAKDKKFRFY